MTMPWHRELAEDLCSLRRRRASRPRPTATTSSTTPSASWAPGRCERHRLRLGERTIVAQACPIGIDVKEVERLAMLGRGAAAVRDPARHAGRPRPDHRRRPAGLQQGHRRAAARLSQSLLSEYPQHRRNVVFMQISAPSREDLPEYRDMRRSIERLVGHLVGRFGDADWNPLRYLNRTQSRRTLAGYYRVARVGLVTPLRDGLNLVAEEYVVAQDPEDPGVLVLSRFAGAASVLEGALDRQPVRRPRRRRRARPGARHAAGGAPGAPPPAPGRRARQRHPGLAPPLPRGAGGGGAGMTG